MPSNLHIDTSLAARSAPPGSRHTRDTAAPGDGARHNPDESFLDNQTPVDAVMAEQNASRVLQRDSHDLSLSPRNVTRDSLVTNMLLSLDQFSMPPHSNPPQYDDDDDSPRFFDIPRYRPDEDGAAHASNWQDQQGHGRQFSHSSDYEGAGDDNSSRLSNQYSRGRRSNSSTAPAAAAQDAPARFNTNRPPVSRGNHARGGRGSKSSSVTSIEQTQAQGNNNNSGGGGQRWNRGVGRSASFDHGPQQAKEPLQQQQQQQQVQQQQQQVQVQQQVQQQQQQHHHHHNHQQVYPQLEDVPQSPLFHTDFINTFLTDDFDAAPTPTVPGGPKRSPSTPILPPPPRDRPERPSTHRNHSTARSIKSSSGGSKAPNSREPAPPMPAAPAAAGLESAPAPNVGYGKLKEPPRPAATAAPPPPPPKERPGFFKRVFGGGSSKSTPAPSPAADSNRPSRLNSAEQGGDSPGCNKMPLQPTQPKAAPAPQPRDTASSYSNHPTLQKKPSSFFRRRKKSVADEAPPVPTDVPPVPPISTVTDKDKFVPMPESSPVSSLRQVMNQYLYDTPAAPSKGEQPREEFQREFSPDYEPSPNARIRKVNSNLDRDRNEREDSPSRQPTQGDTTRDNSFLNLDIGSDNDDEATPTPTAPKLSKSETKEPKDKKGARNDDTIRPQTKSSRRPATQAENKSSLGPPFEVSKSTGSASTGPTRTGTPNVRVDKPTDGPGSKVTASLKNKPLDEPNFVVGEPTEDDRAKAQKIYDGNEDFIQKEKAASWMGEEGTVRQRTLQAYMELYDFASHSVVYSLRQVCGRLVFRAETQQVDRILVAFSKRWCDCNPNHGFKATDVIHTICYSIMLLNTDLHMADIEQKMTRSQFVKNTMGTITQAVSEVVPDAFERRPSILPEKNSMLNTDEPTTPTAEGRRSFRHSFRPPPRVDVQDAGAGEGAEDCGPLVKAPYYGTMKGWEEQVEVVLKGIYSSIRDERLPLFGADPAKPIPSAPSQNSLSVIGMLKRTPSVLSKAPSESNLSARGRVAESRGNTSRWASKSRSRTGLGRSGPHSSRTSFDEGDSMWSPAMSSSASWSRQSLGRTQMSASQDSLGSHMFRGDYQQSIGFANALSQAIIRDEDTHGHETAPSILSADFSATQFLEDESLELAGPPWVKEGMVIHKHHLDGVDKKAKERNWSEVFAVVQKGQMSLFSFSPNKSMRQKSRSRAPAGPVGGGNWQDNATNVGSFNLRQTLASALPAPGYSRTRPHVWALSLPTGAVHLFQVGTPELIKEFVTTANYWSARLSTHPLIGGISNIEYGWGDAIVNNSLVSAINDKAGSTSGRDTRPGSNAAHGRKSSVSSFRSASIDQATAAFTSATGRGKLPGDRIHIAVWAPPTQSLRPSNASEGEQLATLQAYVKGIEDELQSHNQLRSPMLLAFTPRGQNAVKAMANWERKSAYLLREIVKFRTYVDCLLQAENRKQQIYTERDLAQRAARGDLTDSDMSGEEGEGDVTIRP